MPVKCCEVCGSQFNARQSKIRTCSSVCRNRLIAAEKEAKGRHMKPCEVCGKEFEVTVSGSAKRTCSDGCAYELRVRDRRTQVELQCVTCNTGFFTRLTLAESGSSKYCSKQCLYDRNKADTLRKCECCGKEFATPPSQMHVKTCSTECGYKVREVWNEKEKVELACKHCGDKFLEHESKAPDRVYCSRECFNSSDEVAAARSERFSGSGNPGWKGGASVNSTSASGRRYRRQQPHLEAEKSTRRKRAKDRATPDWADLNKVKEIYRMARQISEMTGIPHHVDHMVPLTSDMVCGFHNEFNLQILPGVENLQKHNRHWPDMW